MVGKGGPAAKKAKLDDGTALPACPYGARCYRKNPQHFKEFSHPSDGDDTSDAVPGPSKASDSPKAAKIKASASASIDSSKLPPCQYGAKCYRKNLLHFAEYSHPFTGGNADDDDGGDTDVIDTDDEIEDTDKKKLPLKKMASLGTRLKKSYSKMTEEERRDLIKQAAAAKQELEDKLDKANKEIEKRSKEINKLQKQMNTGTLLMEGEAEALKGNKTVYIELQPERAYKEGSAAQIHFRLAESQFYRLMAGYTGYTLSKVEYVINPVLHKNFKEAQEDMKAEFGDIELSYPVLAFHGTNEQNIAPICEGGFKVPGDKGFKHKTDTGWYGKGVYFSEYPGYCMGYITGSSKLLLCQVLPGKVFQCKNVIHGQPLKKGYTSHTSPDKKELVIFNSYNILPCYIVHYKPSTGEFKYKEEEESYIKENYCILQ